MVEAWVALAWVLTVAAIPVAVWAGMEWGRMAEQDRQKFLETRHEQMPTIGARD